MWVLTNDKTEPAKGKVVLVDARELGSKMRKSLGDKRKELTPAAIDDIVRLYLGAHDETADDPRIKVLPRETFGFQRITVERPMRRRWVITEDTLDKLAASKAWAKWPDAISSPPGAAIENVRSIYGGWIGTQFPTEKACKDAFTENMGGGVPIGVINELVRLAAVADPDAQVVTGRGGKVEPDPDLRDNENVPLPAGWLDLDQDQRVKALKTAAEEHLATEIHPYVPDAWIDHTKTKVGFEIPFTRQFYVYTPPRPVDEIAAEIRNLETQIQSWMKDLGL
ncbi:hypothetical protein [Nostocoides sp. F2B08]|uniref:hypothetical protein n=1 Tax=Nostocoides sp. F2B08 TaxID=2653936 RepID=UPI001D04BC8F|nr:hypothetical protein [Tetrasphaera sp. F2B08]